MGWPDADPSAAANAAQRPAPSTSSAVRADSPNCASVTGASMPAATHDAPSRPGAGASTVTRCPFRDSSHAQARPMTPPPTTWMPDPMCRAYESGRVFWSLHFGPTSSRYPFNFSSFGRTPMATGLYDPAYEHDACGVGMVADLHGRPSHDIVDRGLTVLERLAHRGASGAEVNTGDGAGILVQIPHRFLAAAADRAGFTLPDAGGYAVGLAFLPTNADDAAKARTVVEHTAAEEGLTVLGWRAVPTEAGDLGLIAKSAMPLIEQLFVAPSAAGVDTMTLERRAFVLRKRVEHAVDGVYFPSLSARTIVYKGMLTSEQLRQFFPDLRDSP